METIRSLLTDERVRLLTVTGPAGVGKTRVALAAIADARLAVRFPDGVSLVNLAPLRAPQDVLGAIGHALGCTDMGQRPVGERLVSYLQERATLLVLDNFEQVLPAAASLVELLVGCSGLALLVTSRAPLDVRWEHLLRVAPLPVPDLGIALPALAELSAIPSVTLFLQRARARRAHFGLTEKQAPLVAQLVAQLEGLPLALELAAARLDALPLPAIVRRLEDRLQLLQWEALDLPPRHRSLEAAVGWSYELLCAEEQRLFRCLGVFAGRFTLEAIAAVVNGMGAESTAAGAGGAGDEPAVGRTLRRLLSLAEQSLLLPAQPDEPEGPNASAAQPEEPADDLDLSFTMLETVREYAEERLAAQGELDAARRAHANYFRAMAERAAPLLRGRDQRALCLRLEHEHDNLRAALRWLLDQNDDAEREAALRLAGSLGYFWLMRGYHIEAADWLQAALANAPGADPAVRTLGLFYSGVFLMHRRAIDRSRAVLEEARALADERGDGVAVAEALSFLGGGALYAGDMEESARLLHEALRRARELDNAYAIGTALFFLGARALEQGRVAEAAELEEEAVDQWTSTGDMRAAGAALCGLAVIKGQLGDLGRAIDHVRVALETGAALRDRYLIRMGVQAALTLSGGRADPAWQARLLGAVEGRLAQADSGGIGIYERWSADRGMSKLREQLRQGDWSAALRAGRALRVEDVAALAFTLLDEVAAALPQVPPAPATQASVPAALAPQALHPGEDPLTEREREVLRLVAAGLSSKLIARRLGIAPSTVNYHIAAVFNHLGVDSRAQAVAVATQRGLL